MRLLRKLAIKFITLVVMVVVMGGLMRYARPYIMKVAGVPEGIPGTEAMKEANFSSEESDLMATVFKSAVRLFAGQAKREDLASELSDQLYAGRADANTMSELGIELIKPGKETATPEGLEKAPANASAPNPLLRSGAVPPALAGVVAPGTNLPTAAAPTGATTPSATGAAAPPPASAKPAGAAKPATKAGEPSAAQPAQNAQQILLARLGQKVVANPELTLCPVVILGMVVVHLFRRRRSPDDDFILPDLKIAAPTDTEVYEMKHAVHLLNAEDYELLIALIYQRQGYRVSMAAALGSGRGGDFVLQRKSEKLLVQCKKLGSDHKVPVERVRELQEAAAAMGITRSMYVASCSFSWDARNFAKAKGVTLINARTLDALIDAAREKPDEDLLTVWKWAPKLMSRVQITPPLCPACEAAMDELSMSNGSSWVCSQRPECRGRRSARKHQKPDPANARKTGNTEDLADEAKAA